MEQKSPFCLRCKQPIESHEEDRIQLCPDCRSEMVNYPLPLGIRITAIVVGLVVIVALFRFPAALQAGIAFERGQRAEAAGNHAQAVAEYQQVVKSYPTSTLALARLGIAQYHAGSFPQAVETLQIINGRETSEELATEVNQVIDEMTRLPESTIRGGNR